MRDCNLFQLSSFSIIFSHSPRRILSQMFHISGVTVDSRVCNPIPQGRKAAEANISQFDITPFDMTIFEMPNWNLKGVMAVMPTK